MGLDKLAAQFFSGCKTGNMRRKLLAIVVLCCWRFPVAESRSIMMAKEFFRVCPSNADWIRELLFQASLSLRFRWVGDARGRTRFGCWKLVLA